MELEKIINDLKRAFNDKWDMKTSISNSNNVRERLKSIQNQIDSLVLSAKDIQENFSDQEKMIVNFRKRGVEILSEIEGI